MLRVTRQTAARLVAGAAVLAALVYAPTDALHVWRDTRNGMETGRGLRELAPAHVVGILAPDAILAAARVIPRDATYYVTAGPNAPEAGANARFYVGFFAAFTLLPRRAVPTPEEAQWVLSYGGDLKSLNLPFRRIVRLGPGVSVAEVSR